MLIQRLAINSIAQISVKEKRTTKETEKKEDEPRALDKLEKQPANLQGKEKSKSQSKTTTKNQDNFSPWKLKTLQRYNQSRDNSFQVHYEFNIYSNIVKDVSAFQPG